MAIYLGSKQLTSINLGSGVVSQIYLGSDIIYSASMLEDEMLKYFKYEVNNSKKTVTISEVYFDLWHEDFGNYDINIPDAFGADDNKYQTIVVF